jgi:GT2 family glycosyltransferase
MQPTASIVIPTRDRLPYLDVTLASVAPQARLHGVEVVVVDDAGASDAVAELVARHGARYEPHPRPLGLNAARNTGVQRSSGELVVFLDDDVRAMPGLLEALLEAARAHPEVDVFAGRVTASLEGPAPRSCGRELAPITTLDLGEEDLPTAFAWGSCMTIRRSALERVGAFDAAMSTGGDEQEWQERATRATGKVALYVAKAHVEHRRVGRDARLRSLAASAYGRGRAIRRFDASRRAAPTARREALTLLGCLGHVVRRRCPAGLTMAAHSAGRLREALGEESGQPVRGQAEQDDFLSGASGTVGGLDSLLRRGRDGLAALQDLASGRSRRLAAASREEPPRRSVLVLSVVQPHRAAQAGAIREELMRSRHDVQVHTTAAGERGKFENLNALLAEHPAADHDWLLVIDDDVELPRGFLDAFLFLCERFSLTLAQPAHRLDSHAAWQVTRRHPASVVRETSFVEIGPVTAFAARCFEVLLPFPDLRMGWGLDVHWAALAREHGWRCGIVDAVPIRHRQAPAGAGYAREQAVLEARSFLADRPHISAREAERTLVTHSDW